MKLYIRLQMGSFLSSPFHRLVAPLSKMSIDSRLHHLTNGTSTCPNDAAGDDDDGFLFDPTVLRNIPWSPESQKKFKGGISAHSPGHDLLLRPLHINDYQKGARRCDIAPSFRTSSFKRLKFFLFCRRAWYFGDANFGRFRFWISIPPTI